MPVCQWCETEDDDVAEAAACEHVFCDNCRGPIDAGDMLCPVCNPESVADDASEVDDVEDVDDDSGYVTADEGDDEDWADVEAPVVDAPVVDAPVAEEPAAESDDLAAAQATAAARLLAAIDRANAAVTSAEAALAEHTGKGIGLGGLRGFVDERVAGWSTAVDTCRTAEPYRTYADGATGYAASTEVTDDLNTTATSFEDNAAYVEGGLGLLGSLNVLKIGQGVYASLTGVGEENVAQMAIGGTEWTGANLHALTDDLAGWSSIRQEGGQIVLVRWGAGDVLEVGATGKHTQKKGQKTFDYKLDGKPATAYGFHLAWADAAGNNLSGAIAG